MISVQPHDLPRVPLISENLAKKNNIHFALDTRFRRAARLLQALWLKDRNIPTGHHTRGEGADAVTMEMHSNLSRDAASAGLNFLSPAIHAFTRRELVLREDGAAYDEERLSGNALSSMPLTFNLMGHLAHDLDLASRVFRHLLPGFISHVEGFKFEHSPGRRQERFLNCGTAFDVAVNAVTPDGESATIFVEVKYSEDMLGPAARLRERYDVVSREVGLYTNPESPLLRSLGLEQLWREHMLAQLTVDQGLTSKAVFMAIGPRLNRRVQATFKVYENELIPSNDRDDNRVDFKSITLEAFIDAIREGGSPSLADDLYNRYCNFQRVFDFAMAKYVDDLPKPLTFTLTDPTLRLSARAATASKRTRVKKSSRRAKVA